KTPVQLAAPVAQRNPLRLPPGVAAQEGVAAFADDIEALVLAHDLLQWNEVLVSPGEVVPAGRGAANLVVVEILYDQWIRTDGRDASYRRQAGNRRKYQGRQMSDRHRIQ